MTKAYIRQQWFIHSFGSTHPALQHRNVVTRAKLKEYRKKLRVSEFEMTVLLWKFLELPEKSGVEVLTADVTGKLTMKPSDIVKRRRLSFH